MSELVVQDLHVSVDGKPILKGVDLTLRTGEVHAIMGPNGSGKTTLSFTMAGHPRYLVESGSVSLDGDDLLALAPDERARAGLFLAFQYPSEVPGVTVSNFLRTALSSLRGEQLSIFDFYPLLKEKMDLLNIDEAFANRYLNQGFSGGEKKRHEMLQMALLQPKFGVLDETDSGLDIDALKAVAQGVNSMRGANLGLLVITHYNRILNYVEPDYVHIMIDGRIVRSGTKELALEVEARGYDWVRQEAGLAVEAEVEG